MLAPLLAAHAPHFWWGGRAPKLAPGPCGVLGREGAGGAGCAGCGPQVEAAMGGVWVGADMRTHQRRTNSCDTPWGRPSGKIIMCLGPFWTTTRAGQGQDPTASAHSPHFPRTNAQGQPGVDAGYTGAFRRGARARM
jgi:hypothetical protein